MSAFGLRSQRAALSESVRYSGFGMRSGARYTLSEQRDAVPKADYPPLGPGEEEPDKDKASPPAVAAVHVHHHHYNGTDDNPVSERRRRK